MKQTRKNPVNSAKVERTYARALRKIARHVGDIVRAFKPGDPAAEPIIRRTLEGYADTLNGWAEATAGRMIEAANKQDEAAWRARGNEMARSIREEIERAPTGSVMRELMREQVRLIKSIPLDAAARVNKLTTEGIQNGARASEISAEISRSGEVSKGKANLIARTEVSRTASKLTETRARAVGSDGYVWRTSNDSDVRDSHRKMNGKFVAWNDPPSLDGMTGHAGCFPNCRCYPEVVVPD